jgi:uncharacterized protein
MSRRLALALAVLAAPAAAQPPPPPPPPGTRLHLGATASVSVTPDRLVADLIATATKADPAAAQRQVNARMQAALAEARKTEGMDVQAIGYTVGPENGEDGRGPRAWTAAQTLEIRGADGPRVLDLAGRLQQAGLVAASIDWQLSPEARRRAMDAATIEALHALRTRAEAAAKALGLTVDRLLDVRLDEGGIVPRPLMAAPRMMAAAMPAPSATQSAASVDATVSAEVLLK